MYSLFLFTFCLLFFGLCNVYYMFFIYKVKLKDFLYWLAYVS